MTPELSSLTQQLIEAIFAPRDAAEASQWLEQECGTAINILAGLPFCKEYDEYKMERIRFAVLKLTH